jgi:RNA polymerase primary sigma factor
LEKEAEEAVEVVAAMSRQTDDPLRLYLKEVGQTKLLSRDDETALGRVLEEAFDDALRKIARCSPAITEILRVGAEIVAGNLSLRAMTIPEALHPIFSDAIPDSEDAFEHGAIEYARAGANR